MWTARYVLFNLLITSIFIYHFSLSLVHQIDHFIGFILSAFLGADRDVSKVEHAAQGQDCHYLLERIREVGLGLQALELDLNDIEDHSGNLHVIEHPDELLLFLQLA